MSLTDTTYSGAIAAIIDSSDYIVRVHANL
jgi:hypothetical protein